MKKLFLMGSILLFVVILYQQRALLSVEIMKRALDAQFSSLSLIDLPDGLSAVLCGAGSPMPSKNRSGPCIAVIAGETLFIVDAGDGVGNLNGLGLPAGDIDTVFLTHFHSDHIDGLGQLAMNRWVAGNNSKPLPVLGPLGTKIVVEGFNQAYSQDAQYRNAHHGDSVAMLSGAGMIASEFEVPGIKSEILVYEKNEISVIAFSVDHFPVSPAVGYKFKYKDREIVISGDTKKSQNVAYFSKNADLLIHEALNSVLVNIVEDIALKNNRKILAKIAYDIPDYHTTPIEVAETARDSNVKHLLFYHVVPPTPIFGLEAAWLKGVEEIFPNFTLGTDGTTISLPANSDEVIVN